jgi:cysteine desulfurase/selenocysteine lyase
VVGTARQKASVISFVMEDPVVPSFDIGMKLDLAGVAVRTGHHCCQPVMDFMKIPAPRRARWRCTTRGGTSTRSSWG